MLSVCRFSRAQVEELDRNKQWSRALDGSDYLPGMVIFSLLTQFIFDKVYLLITLYTTGGIEQHTKDRVCKRYDTIVDESYSSKELFPYPRELSALQVYSCSPLWGTHSKDLACSEFQRTGLTQMMPFTFLVLFNALT